MGASGLLSSRAGTECLRRGSVIAYPTEAVYGLGCDPGCQSAVENILELKQRPAGAGLILIADRRERFEPYIDPVEDVVWQRVEPTWPGPVTWLFPRSASVPDWLAGEHPTIALRVTAHPVCRVLCRGFQGAIVSTSANPRGRPPARSPEEVGAYFSDRLAGTVEGALGDQSQPSEIRHAVSGEVVRPG